MKYIKLFENRKKPEIDEKTIRVENKDREWYIDFYFDEKGRLDYVDNKWDVKIPDWYGSSISIITIGVWAKRYDKRINVGTDVYYIIKNEAEKYNL